jgi:hypothetical protein
MADSRNSKYPRPLAVAETTSRRQHDIEKISVNTEDIPLLDKKGTFSFANAYPYIFDAITFMCSHYATKTLKMPSGEILPLIERQDSVTETHYRATLSFESFMDFALDGHDECRHNFLVQLYKLIAHPEKKIVPFRDGYKIITEPVRIELIIEDSTKLSEARKNQLQNLYNKRREGEHITGRVELITIEFYKPFFENLFRKNPSGSIGKNFIQVPKALTARIEAFYQNLRRNSHFKGCDTSETKLRAMEVRKIFFYLALHDNRKGERINIDATDFAESCFPRSVKISYKEVIDENTMQTKVIPSKYISKSDGFEIRKRIKNAISVLSQLGKKGELAGAQFVPLSLDENTVQYTYNDQTYRIKISRNPN